MRQKLVCSFGWTKLQKLCRFFLSECECRIVLHGTLFCVMNAMIHLEIVSVLWTRIPIVHEMNT